MKRRNVYDVHYKMNAADKTNYIYVCAGSKAEAYDSAVYESIKEKEGSIPYSAWVTAVTYQNGNYKIFNTFEGKPY